MKLTDFDALTFDCYGTLIDWETGIFNACQPLLAHAGAQKGRGEILQAFAHYETKHEAESPALIYPDILAATHRDMAAAWGISTTAALDSDFGASVPDWPAFPDASESLNYLADHYKLVILSNVDRKSFARSNVRLKVAFHRIFTAEDIGSYKPDRRNFEFMLNELAKEGVGIGQILHTAQSLHHDHIPAADFDLARCWIDRQQDNEGWGATAPPPEDADTDVDFRFSSMAALVAAHRQALS